MRIRVLLFAASILTLFLLPACVATLTGEISATMAVTP